MKIEFKTVIKSIIVLILLIIIYLSVIKPNIENLPDNNDTVSKTNNEIAEKTKEFTIYFFRNPYNGIIQRFTFDGSYEFDDFDSSSIDVNDEERNQEFDNNNRNKNYESENFEESSTTNNFFIPNHIENQIDLSDKIDNFRRSLGQFSSLNYNCCIKIDRSNLLDDSKTKILCLPVRFLNVTLVIEYNEELGIDAGGLRKEWFNLIFKEILNPNLGYFCPSQDGENTLRPSVNGKNNSSYKYFYRFVGRIIGMALLQDCKVTTNFDLSVYKFLLNKEFKFQDLQVFDQTLYNGSNYYLDNNFDGSEELYFVYDYVKNNKEVSKDIIPRGSQISVTDKNKKSYIKLKTEMILYGLIKDQLNAMKKGLYDILKPDYLNDFNESEFELLLCGISDIDINDWKNNTDYYLYDQNDNVIQWFWRLVEEITVDQRKKLLQFATGSDRVPYGGFANLMSNGNVNRFTISRSNKSNAHLPDAHTCFSRIDIPEYYSYENLKEKFLVAISECSEGFGEQ